MTLALTYEACVRTRSRTLDCQACVQACPTEAISVDVNGAITVALSDCVGCGQCRPACPTEALSAPFDLDALLAQTTGALRCGDDGLPCVAALSSEDLITLGLRLDAITVHEGPCPTAEGHGPVAARVEEAQRVLRALGRPTVVLHHVDPLPPEAAPKPKLAEPSRRQFFAGLAGRAVDKAGPTQSGTLTRPTRMDRDAMRRVPPPRQRLLAALKDATLSAALEGDLSFTSAKRLVPEACTICTICVNICPTGALRATHGWRALQFNASACVKCGLCHAVCEPDALLLEPAPQLSALITGDFAPLGRLRITTCAECGRSHNPSTGRGGLCHICAEMEDEAYALSGLKP